MRASLHGTGPATAVRPVNGAAPWASSPGWHAGGAVDDALVGAAARHHDLPLLTSDRRALRTYDMLRVRVRVIE